jgi:SAM-dependent methyltransferase
MKKLLLNLIKITGYRIEKVKKTNSIHIADNKMQGVFKSHPSSINIYQYANLNGSGTKAFKNNIASNYYKFLDYDCPICKSSQFTKVVAAEEGFKWGICNDCGLLQMHRRLEQKYLNEWYESGEYHSVCMGDMSLERTFDLEHKIMSMCIIDVFKSLDIKPEELGVLEIGCGSGGILLALKDWGVSTLIGYDIDNQLIEYGRTKGLNLEVADALATDFNIESKYNTILLSNVLEHLNDPQEFLKMLVSKFDRKELKLVIDIPNLEFCKEYSNESFMRYLHIGHLWYFNSLTIERLLNSVGLGVDYIFTRGAAFTIICSKKNIKLNNLNNAFWNSVSSINYSNFSSDPNNIGNRIKEKLQKL